MKTFEEIKTEIKLHRQRVNDHNKLWEKEGLSENVKTSRKLLDEENIQIYTDIGDHISSLFENFNDIGVEIKSVETVTQYKEPYHSFYARVDTTACGSHHFVVKGFNYK